MLPLVHEKDHTASEKDCMTLCSELSKGPEPVIQKFLPVSLSGQFLRNPGRQSISLRVQRWRASQGHEIILALHHPLNYTATAGIL